MRPQWETLPDPVREAIEERIGEVLKVEHVGSEAGAGFTACLHTTTDSVFLKAVFAADPAAARCARERWVGTMLSFAEDLPALRLLWSADLEGGTYWRIRLPAAQLWQIPRARPCDRHRPRARRLPDGSRAPAPRMLFGEAYRARGAESVRTAAA